MPESIIFGSMLFQAPMALGLLIALPIIYFLLRVSPPAPRRVFFAPLRLLFDIEQKEETPDKTPWWVLLIRLLALIAIILAFADTYWSKSPPDRKLGQNPSLLLIDDGWASAANWPLVKKHATQIVRKEYDAGRHVILQPLSAAGEVDTLKEKPSLRDVIAQIDGLSPQPIDLDRNTFLKTLKMARDEGLKLSQINWISDGLKHHRNIAHETASDNDSATGSDELHNFVSQLKDSAALNVAILPRARNIIFKSARADAEGIKMDLHRPVLHSDNARTASYRLVARDNRQRFLGASEAVFKAGEDKASTILDMPNALISRVFMIEVSGVTGPASKRLWDENAAYKHVGIVDMSDHPQPLLSESYYIEKAIREAGNVSKGSFEELTAKNVDVIILGDIGDIAQSDANALEAWVRNGGLLIRFSGPRLAAATQFIPKKANPLDYFLPVSLLPASRSFSGSLAWEHPQKMAALTPPSPFYGSVSEADITITRQILAEAGPNMEDKVWAELEDKTPLVTSASLGEGRIIFFHVTSIPDWSDLPLSISFVEMLKASLLMAGSQEIGQSFDGLLYPHSMFDGFGRLTKPDALALPLNSADIAGTPFSQTAPPGLYQSNRGLIARNISDMALPKPITNWPDGIRLVKAGASQHIHLSPHLILLALGLFSIDILIMLILAGKLRLSNPGNRKLTSFITGSTIVVFILTALYETPLSAQTQPEAAQPHPAALQLRFGYIETGDRRRDRVIKAGLTGLSHRLETRTSVEPAMPMPVNFQTDDLTLFPLIYLSVETGMAPLEPQKISKLNDYMRRGGALVIDTNADRSLGGQSLDLNSLLAGLDKPALTLLPDSHVLNRSYYLLDNIMGRYGPTNLWVELPNQDMATDEFSVLKGDGVSPLFIGGGDWVSAWAINDIGRPMLPMEGETASRELAIRFGINLAMYILTGNYKSDQVHEVSIRERLFELNAPSPGDDF